MSTKGTWWDIPSKYAQIFILFSPNLGSESTLAIISRLSPIDMLSATIWNIGATFLPTRAVGVGISSLAKKYTCTKGVDQIFRISQGDKLNCKISGITFNAWRLTFRKNSFYLSNSMSDELTSCLIFFRPNATLTLTVISKYSSLSACVPYIC